MADLSKDQQALKDEIIKSALIWGVVLGVIAAGITFWLTGDMDSGERAQTTGFVGGGVGFLMFLLISWRRGKSSKCAKCSATFSISRIGREETFVSSEEKSEHEKLEGGGSKLTKWVEDKFDVVETYSCSSCGEETTKAFQITRRKDEVVREKGASKGAGDDVKVAPIAGLKEQAESRVSKAVSKQKSRK